MVLAVGNGTAATDPVTAAGPAEPASAPHAPLPPPGFMDGCLKLIEQERYDEARQLLEPVVANHPGWARAQLYLALTYHKEGRYELARGLFERALAVDPEYHVAKFYYGWCLYYLGEPAAARAMFEAFLVRKPDYADAIFALALVDFDADDVESARTRLNRVIELAVAATDHATEAKARARLADVLVRVGQLAAARAELERSIELNPNNYETYFKLSRVLDRLGDGAGAERARQMHQQVRQRIRPAVGSQPAHREP